MAAPMVRTIFGSGTVRHFRSGAAVSPAGAAGLGHGVPRPGAAAWALRGLQAPGAKMEAPAGHRGVAASEG